MIGLNRVCNGFRCVKEEEVKELKTIAYIFEHENTKARLVYLKNEDKNKVFSITFRTPVDNNTGVPHILEHSVLCGSRKYPVKEPFVELLKSSLYTFLNAMTMPDRTMYPVASTNEKDFFNLMNVYLDAVFYPNIYKNKNIFMQEGWHFELEDPADELDYKGVVYNEMKGYYSNPESMLYTKSMNSLFPSTTYQYEYGGLPKEIPNLTYEAFLNFHSTYYHPSNSFIYLYGDLDIEEALRMINGEYLSNFDYKKIDSEVKFEEPFREERFIEDYYPIGANETEEDKTYMSLNFAVANSRNVELTIAMKILEYYLLETPASPITKALLDKKLCTDVDASFQEDVLQPTLNINVIGTNEFRKEEIKDTVFKVLEAEVKKGIDIELMEATINRIRFNHRAEPERDPKGLIYNYSIFQTWLYDDDPLKTLHYEEYIDLIKGKYKDRYFENIIQKYLIENNHRSFFLLLPKRGLAEEENIKLREKLRETKKHMAEGEISHIIEETKDLIKAQDAKDSREMLDKIPTLNINDLEKKAEFYELSRQEKEGIEIHVYKANTNKVVYIDYIFRTLVIEQSDIPYINLFANLLTELSTEANSYENLAKQMNMYAGEMNFLTDVNVDHKDDSVYTPRLIARVSGLYENKDKMLELVLEVINQTKFTEKDKIKEVIGKLKNMLENAFISDGHTISSKRIQSYYSQSARYHEELTGIEFYKFISDIYKNFDQKIEQLIQKFMEIKKKVFKKQNLYILLVSEEETIEDLVKSVENTLGRISDQNDEEHSYHFDLSKQNEGFMTPSDVQYVSKGFRFKDFGYDYNGNMLVLKQLLNLDYLWNSVRVKGGAYGCRMHISTTGDFIVASYRDPNLKNTFAVYDNIDQYLSGLDIEEDFYKYVIGTIGTLDKPLSSYQRAKIALVRYLNHVTNEEVQKNRDEVILAKLEDIKNYQEMARKISEQNMLCVVGNESSIKAEAKIFGKLVNLVE